MDLRDLALQNPWWSDPAAIVTDPHVAAFGESRPEWVPQLLDQLRLDRDRVYTIRGPRQVGKTTVMKLAAKRLLDKGRPPQSVFYFTCDSLRPGEDLTQAIRAYTDFAQGYDVGRSLILIDEVSSVRGWELSIKLLADLGELRGKTLVLTGSHSMDIKRSGELLPGRRGEGEDTVNKHMHPMRFAEFASLVRPSLTDSLGRIMSTTPKERLGTLKGLCAGVLDRPLRDALMLRDRELASVLDLYLLTGGMIRAIKDFRRDGTVPPATYELYARSLVGDLARWRFQEGTAKQVLRSVADRMTTRTSLHSIAKATDISSHHTVSAYIEALEDSFVLSTLYRMDEQLSGPAYRSDKKIYFRDPFMYHAVRGWLAGTSSYFEMSKRAVLDPEEKGRLVEMAVAEHLVRLVQEAAPSDVHSHHERVMYHRAKASGKEVDFVVRHGKGLLPIEVKCRGDVGKGDLGGLFAFRGGLVVTKDGYGSYGDYLMLPAAAALVLL